MSKFRFTAEHFNVPHNGMNKQCRISAADRANALLDVELAKCERVYGSVENPYSEDRVWTNFERKTTHTALLWDVGPIEKISGLFEPNCEPSEGEK